MTFAELSRAARRFAPALVLDGIASRSRRLRARYVVFFAMLAFLLAALAVALPHTLLPEAAAFAPYGHVFRGLAVVGFSLWLALLLLTAFYNSYYFDDVITALREPGLEKGRAQLSYEVAEIIWNTPSADATFGFLRSHFAFQLLSRLGISFDEVLAFLKSRAAAPDAAALSFPSGGALGPAEYAAALFDADPALARFFLAHRVSRDDVLGAARWLERADAEYKRAARSWGRDALGRARGIGAAWAFGQTANLERFAEELSYGVAPSETLVEREVEALEAALARAKDANALIVAEGGGGMDIVYGLVGIIRQGSAFPSLAGRRVFRLDTSALLDEFGEKTLFENEFIRVMNEAVRAGDVILVFDDLPGFFENARVLGTDAAALLYPYLASSRAHIVALSDPARFHDLLERRSSLVSAFEVVRAKEKGGSELLALLEHFVPAAEWRTKTFITYPAVKAVAESAERFFSDGVVAEKARDLLFEAAAFSARAGRVEVGADDVAALVEEKTGVPQEGKVKAEEEEKLVNLEALLHTRVVGQDEAVAAIAGAMRRARAGLRNRERPIGSFLFLGPTGVGKTETAKALGDVFFGASAPLIRLDMSEYSGQDAVERLIGSFAAGRSGTLATALRDQKYGVLLLDEFEKTTRDVMNLFLQILDEGFFSDMHGKKVNARDLIVIATSNAGSAEIFELAARGEQLAGRERAFTDMLVASGAFSPELLNRFDGVVLFHPLSPENLKKIAALMAGQLALRLKEQGIELVVSDDLLSFLAEKGFEPKFGARPMRRVLDESAEKPLADAIIRGRVRAGAKVELVRAGEGLEVRALS